MQYDTIILELLSRIKKLEEKVEDLQRILSDASFFSGNHEGSVEDGENPVGDHPSVTYQRMTDEMVEMCYRCGKKAAAGESLQELVEEIVNTTGMNRNSAIMYLYAVQSMLEGSIYKRAISAKAMQKYFDLILNEYGGAGLRKALQAARLHIAYRRDCGHMVDSIEEICDRYEARL